MGTGEVSEYLYEATFEWPDKNTTHSDKHDMVNELTARLEREQGVTASNAPHAPYQHVARWSLTSQKNPEGATAFWNQLVEDIKKKYGGDAVVTNPRLTDRSTDQQQQQEQHFQQHMKLVDGGKMAGQFTNGGDAGMNNSRDANSNGKSNGNGNGNLSGIQFDSQAAAQDLSYGGSLASEASLAALRKLVLTASTKV
jgi:hypothetical protein